MGRSFGLIAVVIVVAIGGYLYTQQAQTVTTIGTTPETTVDVIGVRNDLTAMAHAQRRYWALNSRYASMEELRSNGDIQIPSRDNYTYSVEASGTGFRITASYSGSDPNAPRRISVDESMTLMAE